MNAMSVIPTQTVTSPAQPASPVAPKIGAVAPAWHTAVILIVLFSFSLVGSLNHEFSPMGRASGRAVGYLLVMVFEWATVAFIWYGLSRRGVRMADLIGSKWERTRAVFRDLGIAVVFLLVCGVALLNGLGYLLKAAPNPAIRNMLPQTGAEIGVYLLLVLTAGFCEEIIFRGYLQRQFSALTQSAAAGIVLQGIAFGLGHGYQGWKFMLLIAVYGSTFGLLANWRRSLRPGMSCHALQDGAGGLLARFCMQ
jgi:membrane protease YdiL (CAAX protease family)